MHQRADILIQSKHLNSESIANIKDQVDRRWQFLMAQAEDRYKLVIYAVNFFKTIQQVKLVLESLAKQYNSEEDFCSANNLNLNLLRNYDLLALLTKVNNNNSSSNISINDDLPNGEKKISQMISKHQQQKESFLKACTLARRNAETFIKYANRCSSYNNNDGTHLLFRSAENKIKTTLEQILKEENNVLDCWSKRKRRLDQCQQFELVEHSTKQALRWIRETGENWLLTINSSKEDIKSKHNSLKDFGNQVKETKEKVKLLVQLCENLIERRHVHSEQIRFWSDKVAYFFAEFEKKLENFEQKLNHEDNHQTLATITSSSSENSSNSILKIANLSIQENLIDPVQLEVKRKSARKREFIMSELLQTERTYVQDLRICIETYFYDYINKRNGKDAEKLFGNLKQIFEFHDKTFLKELEKYESMPEDVGHCFVTFANQFDIYVSYCKNKPDSNNLLIQPEIAQIFDELQKEHQVTHPIAAYLIKPVQRITVNFFILKIF